LPGTDLLTPIVAGHRGDVQIRSSIWEADIPDECITSLRWPHVDAVLLKVRRIGHVHDVVGDVVVRVGGYECQPGTRLTIGSNRSAIIVSEHVPNERASYGPADVSSALSVAHEHVSGDAAVQKRVVYPKAMLSKSSHYVSADLDLAADGREEVDSGLSGVGRTPEIIVAYDKSGNDGAGRAGHHDAVQEPGYRVSIDDDVGGRIV